MPKVLLIEDSEEYQILVSRTLAHLEVFVSASAESALDILARQEIDLILLDIHLPHRDGYSLLAELQSKDATKDVPVICLTGKSAVTDKVTAFSLGAEDYLVKPFDPLELRARVDSRLSKIHKKNERDTFLNIGNIEIDSGRHRVFLHHEGKRQEVELTQTEFKILFSLAKKPDHIFSRDFLLVSVWGEDARVLDRVVDTHVCSLRKKLVHSTPVIKSVPGIGYKLVPPDKVKAKKTA